MAWEHPLHSHFLLSEVLKSTSAQSRSIFRTYITHTSSTLYHSISDHLLVKRKLHLQSRSYVYIHLAYLTPAYLIPFRQWLYDVEIRVLTLRTPEGLVHNYHDRCKRWFSRTQHATLRARGGVNFWSVYIDDSVYILFYVRFIGYCLTGWVCVT